MQHLFRLLTFVLLPTLLPASTASFAFDGLAGVGERFSAVAGQEGLFSAGGTGAFDTATRNDNRSALVKQSLVLMDGIVGGWTYAGYFAAVPPANQGLSSPLSIVGATSGSDPDEHGEKPISSVFSSRSTATVTPESLVRTPASSNSSSLAESTAPVVKMAFQAAAADDFTATPEPGTAFLPLLPLAVLVILKRLKKI